MERVLIAADEIEKDEYMMTEKEKLELIVIKPYHIKKMDSTTTKLAKLAAMICVYSIRNPLHVAFEDGNFSPESDLSFERKFNQKFRSYNGELIYNLIDTFLDEMKEISSEERRIVYHLFQKKWRYLADKWAKLIKSYSKPSSYGSYAFRKFLVDDGHIYIETDQRFLLQMF